MNTKLQAVIATAFILSASTANSITVDIYIDQLTTLSASFNGTDYVGDTNSGRQSVFSVDHPSHSLSDGLLGFDLSSIYSGLTAGQSVVINSASLNIAETTVYPFATSFSILTSDIDADNWNEMTVTFNSYYGSDYLQPWNRVTSLGSGEPNNASDNYLSPISLSLSSVNQANYFDDGYLSLLIWSDEFTFTDPFQFYGADSAKEPFLTIDYEIVTVPVPAALYLLLSGIGALGLIARRKYTS